MAAVDIVIRGHHLPGRSFHGADGDRPLMASIDLTDGCGAPRCARVDEPTLTSAV